MIFLIILIAVLGLILFIFLKPKPAGQSQIVYTSNLNTHKRTTDASISEAKKND